MLLTAVRSALTQDARRRESEKLAGQISKLHSALTRREQSVIALVGQGLMNKQIAWELGIAEITVKVHRSNATKKMGARSLAELVRMLDALQLFRWRVSSSPAMGAQVA
jgi:FixJ family two-component response regulator